MKKKKYLFLTILISVSVTASLFAQQISASRPVTEGVAIEGKEFRGEQANQKIQGAVFVKEREGSSYPAFVKFDKSKQQSLSSFLPWLKQTLKMGSDINFKMLNRESDKSGVEHYRYIQTIKGDPIDKNVFSVQVKNGSVISFYAFVNNDSENTSVIETK